MKEHDQVESIRQAVKVDSCDDASEAHIVVLAIAGMGCVICGARVRNRLLALDGVVSADVDWERGLALVDYVPAQTNIDALLRAAVAASNDGHHHYSAQVISEKGTV